MTVQAEGFNLNYSNGEFADNYTAEINASFNHIPNQTYFIELFMEEDGGGADSCSSSQAEQTPRLY